MSEVKRSYRSPRRQEQAAETRRRILASARRLFTELGYGGATMETIADDAGVAVQTVYAAVGSKKGILMALLDDMAEDADLAGMREAVAAAAGDPPRQLRESVAFTTRIFAGGADLIEIARTVSGLEPDLRELWVEGEARRHRRLTELVGTWADAGALRAGLAVDEAVDLAWALSGPDLFRLLVVERGWSHRRFREHVVGLLHEELFGG